jgi:hypothetical protein
MILPIFANVELPSAIVACALIICPTIFFTVVAWRHQPREVEKLAAYFAGTFTFLVPDFYCAAFAVIHFAYQSRQRL